MIRTVKKEEEGHESEEEGPTEDQLVQLSRIKDEEERRVQEMILEQEIREREEAEKQKKEESERRKEEQLLQQKRGYERAEMGMI